jgi:hypothetical protein
MQLCWSWEATYLTGRVRPGPKKGRDTNTQESKSQKKKKERRKDRWYRDRNTAGGSTEEVIVLTGAKSYLLCRTFFMHVYDAAKHS